MKITQVYEWHKPFRDGRASVNDDPRLRTTLNFEERRKHGECAECSVRGESNREIAEVGESTVFFTMISIRVSFVNSILHKDFNTRFFRQHLVPKC
jgi:hypothetical protein